jgi:hypothetical protein
MEGVAGMSTCPSCPGDGWATERELRNGHVYETVRPCACGAGRQHDDVHRRIVEHNEREMRRVGVPRGPRLNTMSWAEFVDKHPNWKEELQ